MNEILIDGAVTVPKHLLKAEDIALIETQLNYKSVYQAKDEDSTVAGYLETPDVFRLPRFWFDRTLGRKYANKVVDAAPSAKRMRWKFHGELRKHQAETGNQYASFPEVADAILKHNGVFVSAPCGSGKTVCALYTIAQLGVPTIILTPNETVRMQWIEAVKTFLPQLVVTEYSGKRKNLSGDIVVASLQLVSLREVLREFPFLVLDEAHMASTKEFQKAMYNIRYRWSLALTATGDRFDGMDPLFRNALSAKELELDTDQMPVTVRFEPFKLTSDDETELSKMGPKRIDHGLALVGYRNSKILKTVHASYVNKRRIVVISKSIPQLQILRSVFAQFEPDARTALFCGEVTKYGKVVKDLQRTRQQVALDERYIDDPDAVLFATVGKAGVGWDCKEKDALIFGLPMLDIRQVLGRVQRYLPGKKKPIAYYPVDEILESRALGTYWKGLYPLIERKACLVDNRCDFLDLAGGPDRRARRSSSTKSQTSPPGQFFTTNESQGLFEAWEN